MALQFISLPFFSVGFERTIDSFMKSLLQDAVILMNNHCVCWDVAQMLQRYLYHHFHVHESIVILEEFGINLWILSRGCLCFSVISQTAFRISLVSCYEFDEGHENNWWKYWNKSKKYIWNVSMWKVSMLSMEIFPNSNDQPGAWLICQIFFKSEIYS
jgi:hypothetical protein